MRAGIDIGTNSVRLLVLADDGSELARTATVTGLGRGLADGLLHPDSVARTIDGVSGAVAEAARVGLVIGPSNTRITATSAARDARNGAELLDAIQSLCGVRPEVLSGQAEGSLAWAGAMSELPTTAPVAPDADLARGALDQPVRLDQLAQPGLLALIDIGGGSTEFVVGHVGSEPLGAISIDVGCVRLTERFLTSDPPTAVQLSSLIGVVHAHLDDVQRELPAVDDATRFVGVAGSIITVAAVELGRYDRDAIHGMWLSRAAAEDVFRTLAQEKSVDRGFNPGLHPDRVGTIVAGAAILVTVMRHFDLPGIQVSQSDLLDALARSALRA